jgi:hypothetical protein|tara:strand:- start:71 stop:247 length:177 start_codon:yes stop_codon:yes gene_type:complete
LAHIAFKDKLPENVVWRKDKLVWQQPSRSWISGSFGLGGPGSQPWPAFYQIFDIINLV